MNKTPNVALHVARRMILDQRVSENRIEELVQPCNCTHLSFVKVEGIVAIPVTGKTVPNYFTNLYS